MKKIFFALGAVALLGAGCSGETSESGKVEQMLAFTLNDESVRIDESTVAATSLFSASDLTSAAEECGTAVTPGHFENIMTKLADVEVQKYELVATGDVQEPESFVYYAMPNVLEYSSFEEFEKDFDVCAAAATYPHAVTEQTLVLVRTCSGAGAADDTNRPQGCEVAKASVEQVEIQ